MYVRGQGARRRGRDPALRLVGRRALAGRLRGVRRAVLGAHPRRGRRAHDPLRHRHGDAARADGGGGRRRDRARLADPARPRAGTRSATSAACRATSTRRCCSGRGSASRRRRATCSTARAAGPATSSTSATASSRTPTRTSSAGSWSSSTRRRSSARRVVVSDVAVVLMAYGSPERLDGRSRVLRRHPRRPADPAGAARRPRRALPAARDRRGLAAERDHRGDARGARARARRPRLHRHAALDAADRRGGGGGARRRRADDRRARARAALLAHVDRPLPRAAGGGDRGPRASSRSSRAGATSRASSTCSPTGSAAPTRTSSSPPTRCRPGSSTRATRTRSSCSRPRGSSPQRAGVEDWTFSYQSESATGEPWLGPDILDHLADLHARGVRSVRVCPVGFVADHLEIRWDLDTEARERARELGLELDRIEMPNADPAFVRVLAGLVRRAVPLPSRT